MCEISVSNPSSISNFNSNATSGNVHHNHHNQHSANLMIKPIPELMEIRARKFQHCLIPLTFIHSSGNITIGGESVIRRPHADPKEDGYLVERMGPPLIEVLMRTKSPCYSNHHRHNITWIGKNKNGDNVTWNSQPLSPQHISSPLIISTPFLPSMNEENVYCSKTINMSALDAFYSDRESVKNMTWQFGEDIPGNQKYGFWIDSKYGGRISFTVKVRRIMPVITIGYMESYTDKMGIARAYLDNDYSRVIEINSRSTASHTSQSKSISLCWEAEANKNNGNGTNGVLNLNNASQKTFQPKLQIETCSSSHSHRSVRFRQWKMDYDDRVLHVELLPSGISETSKFKILFISTC